MAAVDSKLNHLAKLSSQSFDSKFRDLKQENKELKEENNKLQEALNKPNLISRKQALQNLAERRKEAEAIKNVLEANKEL